MASASASATPNEYANPALLPPSPANDDVGSCPESPPPAGSEPLSLTSAGDVVVTRSGGVLLDRSTAMGSMNLQAVAAQNSSTCRQLGAQLGQPRAMAKERQLKLQTRKRYFTYTP